MQKQKINLKSSEFQCNNDFILVRPEVEPSETITPGGIVVLAGRKNDFDRPTSGTIITFGPDAEGCSVGLFVAWPSTDGIDAEFKDGDFVIIRQRSILGHMVQVEQV